MKCNKWFSFFSLKSHSLSSDVGQFFPYKTDYFHLTSFHTIQVEKKVKLSKKRNNVWQPPLCNDFNYSSI